MKHRIFLQAGVFLAVLLIHLYPAVSLADLKVGVIYTGNLSYYRKMHYAFARELMGRLPARQKVKFVRQSPFPDPIAWSNAARKLVVMEVDLIVAYGFPATHAVLSKRSKIPVVYAGVYKPEITMAENKGKTTGCGYEISLSTILDHLTKTSPVKRLHVAYTHNESDSIVQMKEIAKLAEQQNIELVELNIGTEEELKQLYNIKEGDALFITGSAFIHSWIEAILSITQTKKIPTVNILPVAEEKGAMLISYYQDPEKMGQKAAEIAAKILTGVKSQDIEPVVMTESDLTVNVQEAKRLGCSIPDQLVDVATKVIQ